MHLRSVENVKRETRLDNAAKLFEKATHLDPEWATIAYYNHAYCIIGESGSNYLDKSMDSLKKAKTTLFSLRDQCSVTNCILKMSSTKSNSEGNQQFFMNMDAKFEVLNFYEKNIEESLKKLTDIKQRERDAIAEKAGVFPWSRGGANNEIHEELYEFYKLGLINVFSVKEKPRFCWEGLLLFFLGLLQVVVGITLAVFTVGALANIGMALIGEGIGDMISGAESMIKGEFSWEQWGIAKAISIGVSLITGAIGKVMKHGVKGSVKAAKAAIKNIKRTASEALPETFKKVMIETGKQAAEQTVMYFIGKAEDEILELIYTAIKESIHTSTREHVGKIIHEEPLMSAMNKLCLHCVKSPEELELLLDSNTRRHQALMKMFASFVANVDDDYRQNIGALTTLFESINQILLQAQEKCENKGVKAILACIQLQYLNALSIAASVNAGEVLASVGNKVSCEIDQYLQKRSHQTNIELVCTPSEQEVLKQLREKLGTEGLTDTVSELVNDNFQGWFTRNLGDFTKGKFNNWANNCISNMDDENDENVEQDSSMSADLPQPVPKLGENNFEEPLIASKSGEELEEGSEAKLAGRQLIINQFRETEFFNFASVI